MQNLQALIRYGFWLICCQNFVRTLGSPQNKTQELNLFELGQIALRPTAICQKTTSTQFGWPNFLQENKIEWMMTGPDGNLARCQVEDKSDQRLKKSERQTGESVYSKPNTTQGYGQWVAHNDKVFVWHVNSHGLLFCFKNNGFGPCKQSITITS